MRTRYLGIKLLLLAVMLGTGCGREENRKEQMTEVQITEAESEAEQGTEEIQTTEAEDRKEDEASDVSGGDENEQELSIPVTECVETMYAQARVNVRAGNSTDYEKIGTLEVNEEVHVTGRCDNGWYRIEYHDITGYVSDDYLGTEQLEEAAEADSADNSDGESGNPDNSDGQEDWVGNLSIAQNTDQIIVVAANGSSAKVSMHNKNGGGSWTQILSTNANIGRNGIGKTSEGDGKTPTGVYGFSLAFGKNPNPGTSLSYTQVDDSYYWVDDSDSAYYNQFVSTNNVACDWDSAEHISEYGRDYNYLLAINYNPSCTPGAGSAIFMHCIGDLSTTSGCIAIPESGMIQVLQNVQPGCTVIIDSESGVHNY